MSRWDSPSPDRRARRSRSRSPRNPKRDAVKHEKPQKRSRWEEEDDERNDNAATTTTSSKEVVSRRGGDDRERRRYDDRGRDRDRDRDRYRRKRHRDKDRDEDDDKEDRKERRERDRPRSRERSRSRSQQRDRNEDRRKDRPRPKRRSSRSRSTSQTRDQKQNPEGSPPPKEQPNFNRTSHLVAETNTFNGVVLKYVEPPESRLPPSSTVYRLYTFKSSEIIDTTPLSTRTAWLIGRDRLVADLPIDHPSASKQHAVIQFRFIVKVNEWGEKEGKVKPYIIDLGSANGTKINGEEIPKERYVELMEKDVITFGHSSREYVLMLEK
ncbi:Kanadaptin [Arthrobotrys entomopaga]|nr:Kanadaptin [Arthrobotrys entomopaga]